MNLSSVDSVSLSSQPMGIFSMDTTSLMPDAGWTVTSFIGGKTEDGCRVMESNPVNNPDNLVSKQTHLWLSTINYAVIIPALFLLGVPGNILSAAVFYRQGLRERINLCVFCLALTDLAIIFVVLCLGAEKTYRSLIGPFSFFIRHFVGLTGFTWVSMFLSAVIAAERCFCVVSPLRAQRMLSTRTLAVIIFSVSIVLLSGVLVLGGTKLTEVCVFDVETNTTSFIVSTTKFHQKHKAILDIFDVFVYSMVLPPIFLGIVIITTVITTAKLRSALRWRQQSSSASGVGNASETQMVALTWMLVATSVLFVLCTCPVIVVQMSIYSVKNLNHGGRYHNLNQLAWSYIDLLRVINSSLNFLIYYRMGSRFRQTLTQLLTCTGTDQKLSRLDRVASVNASVAVAGVQRVSSGFGKEDFVKK